MCTATATAPATTVTGAVSAQAQGQAEAEAQTPPHAPVWTGDQVRLQLQSGRLWVTAPARPPFVADRAVRPFPYSSPRDVVVLMSDESEEEGWLTQLDRLDATSRQVLDSYIQQEYLIPHILKIAASKEEFDIITWQALTDRGPRTIEIRGRRNIRWIGPGRVLVRDADGNRFEIPQVDQLDPQSRDIVDAEL